MLSASRFVGTIPHYLPPAAPVAFAHSRWVATTSLPPIRDTVISDYFDTPKSLFNLPDGMIDQEAPLGENARKIRAYLNEKNLKPAFREKVLTNCLTDLEAIASSTVHKEDGLTLLACIDSIKLLPQRAVSGEHPRISSDFIDELRGILSNTLLELGYIGTDGKVKGTDREIFAIPSILEFIDQIHEDVLSKPRYQ
jgi:hypothetical protein